MKKRFFTILTIIFLLAAPGSLFANYTVTGITVGVADGDTIRVRPDNGGEDLKIRLYGIDTPETAHQGWPGQPYSDVAKKLTNGLCRSKRVSLDIYDTDRYGRHIAVVYQDNINVNEMLIRAGLATVYRQYCRAEFCGRWKELEEQARLSGTRMWSDPNWMNPADWRKQWKK